MHSSTADLPMTNQRQFQPSHLFPQAPDIKTESDPPGHATGQGHTSVGDPSENSESSDQDSTVENSYSTPQGFAINEPPSSEEDPKRTSADESPGRQFLPPSFCMSNPAMTNVSASLKAYADRMQADYFRYRIAKESADNFYNRLAVFQNTFNPFRHYLNPLALRNLMPPQESPGVDLSLKNMGMGLPVTKQFPIPTPLSPFNTLDDISPKKRLIDQSENLDISLEKKQKLSLKRKVAKKLNFDEETSSPVSGTLIRQLAEGESMPEVRKGRNRTLWGNTCIHFQYIEIDEVVNKHKAYKYMLTYIF